MPASLAKRRTNVTIRSDLLEAARAFDLNVSALTEKALGDAVRAARAKAWAEENAEAIVQQAAWIEEHGLPLAQWQVWKPE